MQRPWRRRIDAAALALLATGALAACNGANFRSSTDKTKDGVPLQLRASCNDQRRYDDGALDLKVAGLENEPDELVTVEGEFCPQAPAELRLVFAVDFSLSMYNAEKSRGNDPVEGGTCGRLEAVRAIVKRHAKTAQKSKSAKDADTDIKVGVVQFASDLVGEIPLTAVADLDDELTVKNFCRGIDGTNYKVAFEAVTKMLDDEPGTKVVYLISDGLPTEGGGGERENAPRHRDAAQKAADAMRDSIDDLVYNTVFLGNVHELDDPTLDPEKFLEELTGDPSRVKLVDKASELASKILDLEPPPVDLDTTTAAAALAPAPSGTDDAAVDLDSFLPGGRDQVWSFKTKPFKPFPGGAATSQLTVRGRDRKGAEYRVTFTLAPGAAAAPAPAATP
jgi:hypothetical protein